MQTLPQERAALQREIRSYIHQIGPELGSLYTDKEVKWDEYIRHTNSSGREIRERRVKDMVWVGALEDRTGIRRPEPSKERKWDE